MGQEGSSQIDPPSRDAVDAAIGAALAVADEASRLAESRRAAHMLAAHWRAAPSSAAWIAGRFQKLAPALAAPTCDLLVLRSFTLEPVVPLARACMAEYGVDLRVRLGEFNAWTQELLSPASAVYQDPSPDAIVLAVQTRDTSPALWFESATLDGSALADEADRVAEAILGPLRALRERSQAHVIVHALEKPAAPATGILESSGGQAVTQSAAIDRVNAKLREAAASMPGVYVLDYDGLIARFGRDRWYDEDKFLTVRLPMVAEALLPLAREWSKHLLPALGRQAKCLVLDLDNTLWGGVVGEDGPTGIRLGVEHPGAHYMAIQRAALDLYHRGILLALCSKNNPDDAMEVIEKHPHMVLGPEHFAAVRVNWTDKAQNLREIAADLNIGVDSLVFLDDNPVERELVRSLTPEATVLEPASDHPRDMLAAVRNCPLFERLALSGDDRKRGQMYAQQRQRAELESSAGSLADYLRSLEMEADVGLLDASSDGAIIERVAQLTQKTNQLNTTTKRYTVQQIRSMAGDPAWRIYWVGVRDRFGDNGIVGVMIANTNSKAWELDSFLMSCRVIGRTVETCMLATLAEHARQAGAPALRGWFLPTKKNPPAEAIYREHGFAELERTDEGVLWGLDIVADAPEQPQWITRQVFLPTPA
ncbi:MAG: HAD-IIIC family phosphatase [Phycisphaera sp.]|nr:MAG: HAD-IIIC family phosphatase [Phycisphaera sp.]